MRCEARSSGFRLVACAIMIKVKRHKTPATAWRDTRDCGGIYDRLEDWMRVTHLSYPDVSFKLEVEKL